MDRLRARTSAARAAAARAPHPVAMTDTRVFDPVWNVSIRGESARSASIVVSAHPPPSGIEGASAVDDHSVDDDDRGATELFESFAEVVARRTSVFGVVGATTTTSRATGPSGSARQRASSASKEWNNNDSFESSRRVSTFVSSRRASRRSSFVSFVPSLVRKSCLSNDRRNARVRRSTCLNPPSRGVRKSATKSGFSRSRGSLASANTATSSSRGTLRTTASAVSTAASAVASEIPGSIAMTVAPTSPGAGARAAATEEARGEKKEETRGFSSAEMFLFLASA